MHIRLSSFLFFSFFFIFSSLFAFIEWLQKIVGYLSYNAHLTMYRVMMFYKSKRFKRREVFNNIMFFFLVLCAYICLDWVRISYVNVHHLFSVQRQKRIKKRMKRTASPLIFESMFVSLDLILFGKKEI